MNLIQRRRILRARTIMCKRAAAHLTEAENGVRALDRMGVRMDILRREFAATHGETFGLALAARAEMTQRLRVAATGLSAPQREAECHVVAMKADLRRARQAEHSATILHAQALKAEDLKAQQRADAAPVVRRAGHFEDASL
jgi:tRNA pseudouridine-54 N-methylase